MNKKGFPMYDAMRIIRANYQGVFVSFCAVLIFYIQYLAYPSYSTDDYAAFYTRGHELASWLGRWAAGLFNQYVFTEERRILLYLNGLVGIAAFFMAAYLTVLFWINGRGRLFMPVLIIILLMTVNPFVAHNLYFKTNVSAWIGVLFSVIGAILVHEMDFFKKFLGIVMLVLAIGSYQTNVQIAIVLILVWGMHSITRSISLDEAMMGLRRSFSSIALVIISFFLSVAVNRVYLQILGLEEGRRYASALNNVSIEGAFSNLLDIYQRPYIDFLFYDNAYYMFLLLVSSVFFLSLLMRVIRKEDKTLRILSTASLFLFLVITPLVIFLPKLAGMGIPVRAHYALGWLVGGMLFLISFRDSRKVMKSIVWGVALFGIVLNMFYVNVYFDAAYRQTQRDILVANQMVNRIRMHEGYRGEPVRLMLVGNLDQAVPGWDRNQQAFYKDFSKYAILRNFTDLKFSVVEEGMDEVAELVEANGGSILPYPAAGSIVAKDDRVVVFLSMPEGL